jgi:hypothetical protein
VSPHRRRRHGWSGRLYSRERAPPVKPSAQPTLVRTQHLPPGEVQAQGRYGVSEPLSACAARCHRTRLSSIVAIPLPTRRDTKPEPSATTSCNAVHRCKAPVTSAPWTPAVCSQQPPVKATTENRRSTHRRTLAVIQAGQPGARSISEPWRDFARVPGSRQILHQQGQAPRRPVCTAEARTRSLASGSSAAPIATAVGDPLCGSTPITTAAIPHAKFLVPGDARTAAGMPDYGAGARPSFEPRHGEIWQVHRSPRSAVPTAPWIDGVGDAVAYASLAEIGPAPHEYFGSHEKLASATVALGWRLLHSMRPDQPHRLWTRMVAATPAAT